MSKEECKLPELPDADFITCGCTGDAAGYSESLMIEYASKAVEVELKETQAAANKAAEEGGPTDSELAQEVLLEDLEAIANYWDGTKVEGYQNEEIDVGNYLREKFAALKFPAIAADRASRQVANKEVQEARAAYKDRPTYDENVSIGSRDFFEMLIEYGKEPSLSKRMEIADFVDSHIDKLVANKAEVDLSSLFRSDWSELGMLPASEGTYVDFDYVEALFVTPPATTSASTVSKDPSMPRDMTQAIEWIIGLRARVDSLLDVIEAEREVGASTVLTDELSEFQPGQWWIEELSNLTTLAKPTADMVRAGAVARRFAKLVFEAREVAAQAGQVAVPGWISVDDRLPENGKDVIILYWPYDNHENERVAGTAHHVEGTFYDEDGNDMHPPSHWMPFVIPFAAPSPAKESK